MADEFARLTELLAGRYGIDREIGHGGMATVYLAHDIRHDRTVAIKVLRPDLSALLGPERFHREIVVTARLDHPHIVPLLDSGEAEGFLYYVMPYVDGESLRDRLRRERQLPVPDALAILREVADALEYAHTLGVIHRDIKPENILLAGGHARLGDFGIARVVAAANGSAREALTVTGVAIGTTVYMSPEQAAGERELDRRTDIYSLAAVAYEMLAGQPPHAAATAEAVLARKLREPASSLRIVRESVPRDVDDAIRKALAKTPADRFSTTRQFAEALARVPESGDAPPAAEPHDADISSTAVTGVVVRKSTARFSGGAFLLTALVATAVGTALFWFLGRDAESRWLASDALPKIEQYLDVADFESAFALANEIKQRRPDSRELSELWPRLSWRVSITSEPAGATVFRQAYNAPADKWEVLGQTPLTDIRFPYGLSRLRFEMKGYRPLTRAMGGAHLNWAELTPGNPDALLVGPETFTLDTEQTLPPDKIRVARWKFVDRGQTLDAGDSLLDRYEVTNAEYKKFVDAGGYQRREWWDPVVVGGKDVAWEDAMRLFVDRTGRPGPSTWVAGDHRDGQANLPVSGVSWYEAAAYARFAGQELPTAHHWQEALANSMFPWLLPASNFGGSGPRPVSESRAMTHVGAFDMTGNVREWTSSAIGAERIILGGSWSDPYYVAGATDSSAAPADRSEGNGFRLMTASDQSGIAARLRAPIERTTVSPNRDQQAVPEVVFAAHGRVFDYRRGPLNASVEAVDRTRVWTRERVRFDAGYGDERMLLHLYVPTIGAPPYQTVLYWPGWDTFSLDDIDQYFAKQLDFIVKSGRAVAFPIYKGIFERRVGNVRRRPAFNTTDYRDNTIDGVKDLRRTLDYLETRADIDSKSVAFFGYSWGGVNGPVALAHEPRLRAAVIDIGLLPPMSTTPEVDPVNALPRVHQPTLMFSGEFDSIVPIANAKRYFSLIGAAPADKRHVIVIGGHFVPRELLIREVLDWLDARLGRIRR